MNNKDPHILIVDDEIDLRSCLKRKLVTLDFKVDTASNGSEALKIINNSHIDLVVLDLSIDSIGGKEVINILKSQNNPIKIIVCTGTCFTQEAEEALINKGIDALLHKPVNMSEIVNKINNVLSTKNTSYSCNTEIKDTRIKKKLHTLKNYLGVISSKSDILKMDFEEGILGRKTKAELFDYINNFNSDIINYSKNANKLIKNISDYLK